MPVCPSCKDARYLVEKNGERTVAKVCACNETCTVCGGSGHTFVEEKGYTFVRPCGCRSIARRVTLFNQARLPARAVGFTFETFTPETEEQNLAKGVAETTARRYRPDSPSKGLIVSGPVGTGKTHLLCAALRYLTLEVGVPSRYVEISFLFSEIKNGFQAGKSGLEAIAPLVDVEVLAIDEIGKGRGSGFELDTLDELIARRYNSGRTTLFATNLSLAAEAGKGGYVDPVVYEQRTQSLLRIKVGERIYSRLFEMCHAIEFPSNLKDHRKSDKASLAAK
ncbi:MAG: ATP-binding protein [Deltaproteobacteria bacterium]|nr:ATP-binding protein [Deltaproteobacteria bacterium]